MHIKNHETIKSSSNGFHHIIIGNPFAFKFFTEMWDPNNLSGHAMGEISELTKIDVLLYSITCMSGSWIFNMNMDSGTCTECTRFILVGLRQASNSLDWNLLMVLGKPCGTWSNWKCRILCYNFSGNHVNINLCIVWSVQYSLIKYIFVILQESWNTKRVACVTYGFLRKPGKFMCTPPFFVCLIL